MSELDTLHELRPGPPPEGSARLLEASWQARWRTERAFATPTPSDERAPAYVFAGLAPAADGQELTQIRGFTIADVCARFLRARGRAVLFSLGFDAFGEHAEAESLRSGMSPHDWAQSQYRLALSRLERLGCSHDWERAFLSSEPQLYRWTQWLFLTLLERGQIYRRGTSWLMRIDPAPGEDARLAALTGWDEATIALQREAVGRVDGVELQVNTFASGALTVFTPHAQAIAKAQFVAISPAHPDLGRWTSDHTIAERVAAMNELGSQHGDDLAKRAPVVVTDELAMVPGVAGMLPIVISPLVDMRFGPTAVLGVPELDPLDRDIAERLPARAGMTWKVSGSRAAMRPGVRYPTHDVAISRRGAWGAPVPVSDCPDCGAVPVPVGDLPVCLPDDLRIRADAGNPLAQHDGFYQCTCSNCGGAAVRETATIDCRMDRMWMWMAICVPSGRRSSAPMSDCEIQRWLPVEQVVADVGAAGDVFTQRMLVGMLQDRDELPPLPDREPFSRVLTYGEIRIAQGSSAGCSDGAPDGDTLLARAGGDALRLAILYAASPGRSFSWDDRRLHYSERLLRELYDYAQPRLHEHSQRSSELPDQPSIDTSDVLRRRFAHWCAVACEQLTVQLEALQPQRAAHNVVRLLTRIQDFESRALERRGELDVLDREAIAAALLLLVRLMAPLTPHIAEELWSSAGCTASITEAGWPTHPRPRPIA